MKKILLAMLLLATAQVNAQWCAKKVDNGLDTPYKICYNRNVAGEILKMENTEGKVTLYVMRVEDCDQLDIDTDVSLLVNGVWQKYKFNCNSEGNLVVLSEDLLSSGDFTAQFKAASKIKFRLNFEECEATIHEFNMLASASSLNFISKP
jgi:hypothetical protein